VWSPTIYIVTRTAPDTGRIDAQSRRTQRSPWLLGLLFTARVLITVGVLVAAYYAIPLDRPVDGTVIIVLLALAAVGVLEVRAILRSDLPRLKAVEALAVLGTLLMLSFAAANVLMSESDPSNFSEPLTRTDALYFAMTVFSTVGFGDINANSQLARGAVALQIAVNLVFVGLGLRIIVGAAQQSHERGVADGKSDDRVPSSD
jgi:voltage-gated potassium channel